MFAIAAVCFGYGASHWYGWVAVPVAVILVGLAAWGILREKTD